jgi:hypothetical protein
VKPILGINLPWFFGAYGHDLAPNERHPTWGSDFDTMRAYRPLIEARELGFDAVRVWLCECGEGIVTKEGRVAGVHPSLSEAVRVIQECAKLAGLRIYWTLLDGNSWQREGDALTHRVVADAEETARFARLVAAPLARLFDPALTLAVEVVNEPEAMTAECMADSRSTPVGWAELGRAVRTIGDALRAERGALVTAGTMHVFLPKLLGAEPRVDAIDLHMYHAAGGLPSREDLVRYTRVDAVGALPLIAGECGMPEEQADITPIENYLYNADSRAYSAAFLWRLEGVMVDTGSPERHVTSVGKRVRSVLRDRH